MRQDFQDYEIIICDDCSTDNTEQVVRSFDDKRIRYYKNNTNIGYGRNLQVCYEKATKDIIFLMAHDDILLSDALSRTYNAFGFSHDIGVVARPYYWFDLDPKHPVRAVRPYDSKKDAILSVFDGKRQIEALFKSAGQLSGLAYRRKYMDTNFHVEVFPAHIYPFASILRRHKAVYLKDYTVAVRIESSMTRHKREIYETSPTETWIRMFENVYAGDRYNGIRTQCVDFISKNFAGLVQLKNYASMRILLREIRILIKYRWRNVFNVRFWFFSLITILTPRRLLVWLTDNFKRKVLSRTLRDIDVRI